MARWLVPVFFIICVKHNSKLVQHKKILQGGWYQCFLLHKCITHNLKLVQHKKVLQGGWYQCFLLHK
jgi:hypothetical protein